MSRKLFRTATLGAASITAVLAFGVTGASAATVDGADVPCQQTGLVRDGSNLTAAVKDPTASVSVDVDATGCDIGVYYGSGTSGSVNGADIQGAKYYGIVVNAAVVEVDGAKIHDIGDTPIGANNPLRGMQRGVGVLYTTLDQANEVKYQNGDQSWVKTTGTRTGVAKGHIKDSVIEDYQKNGVVVSGPDVSVTVNGNEVTGAGSVDYIAQNGIQVSRGATATVNKNTVKDNWYADSPDETTACGLLFYKAGGVSSSGNKFRGVEQNLCNYGQRGGGKFSL